MVKLTSSAAAQPSARRRRRHPTQTWFPTTIMTTKRVVHAAVVFVMAAQLLFLNSEEWQKLYHNELSFHDSAIVRNTTASVNSNVTSRPLNIKESAATANISTRETSSKLSTSEANLTASTEEAYASSIADDWGICDPRIVQKSYQPQGRIFLVTFAGWDETRKEKMRQFEESLRNRKDVESFPIHSLFYTEEDLPQSHFDEFAWAYEKPDYRGFWSWKPWILRNLTATGVFAPGDLVLWMDSDERLRMERNNVFHPYVRTLFCNMEHRNENNYAGIYPFERCFRHAEGLFTKPDVFGKMGLDPAIYSKQEQIYGGSVGFKVTQNNDTLEFLQEWTEYCHDPILLGDDENFPSTIPPPQGYVKHKNDQSIFSLMARSRNMTTWPPPYFWRGDSGVKECLPLYQKGGYCFTFQGNGVNLGRACGPFDQWIRGLPPPVLNA